MKKAMILLACLMFMGTAFAAETAVSEFVVTDATSGSAIYTDEETVNVSLVGEPLDPAKINGYMITTTSAKPEAGDEGWSVPADLDFPVCPFTEYILSGEGMNTLYGWVRDDAGAVAGKSAAIGYSTAGTSVAISNVKATSAMDGFKVSWTTNVPAVGWLSYGRQGESRDNISATFSAGTSHTIVVTGVSPATLFDLGAAIL